MVENVPIHMDADMGKQKYWSCVCVCVCSPDRVNAEINTESSPTK